LIHNIDDCRFGRNVTIPKKELLIAAVQRLKEHLPFSILKKKLSCRKNFVLFPFWFMMREKTVQRRYAALLAVFALKFARHNVYGLSDPAIPKPANRSLLQQILLYLYKWHGNFGYFRILSF
jgi:hypothetical protein